ncbi:major facilitator superfamily domain-containing protein [Linnemannia elongata]|nr:major facilitator superfamily domain-containing protein [Linnemannia elongata]
MTALAAQQQGQDYGPKSPMSKGRQMVVFLGILMVLFLAALDQSIVTTALPSISKDFNNFSEISWVGTGFLLTMTAIQPLYGIAADLAGRKRTMMFANAVFFVGSALCGAARSMNMLIIGRAVQGIGGSGILTLSLILVADIVPLRNRGKYQSLTAFVYALASVFGPLLGGAFSDNVTWRWAFYINLPVGAVGMVLLAMFLHMNRPMNLSLAAAMRSLDYAGIVLLIGAIIMILLGLNWGADAKYEWGSAVILCLLIIGVLVMVAFLVNEWKVAVNPIIPLRLLGTLSLGMTYLPVFVDGFVSMGLLFFLPLYSQAVHGASAIESGVELLPYVCMSSVVAIIVGQLTSRWGTYKEFIIFGWFAGVLSTGLMVLFDENTGRGRMVGILLVQGISLGAVVNTQLLAVHAQLSNPADMALSTSLWTLLRTFGGVFGVALGGTLVQCSLSNANASKYAQSIKGIADLAPELRAPVLKAFVEGLQKFFILLAALSGIAFLASFFIKKVAMDGSDSDGDTVEQGDVQELEDAARHPVEKLDDSPRPLSTV